jgi:uncharacterized phage protein (TIGR02218 family)
VKTISTAYKTHLAQPYQTRCFCWLLKRTDGTIVALTEHDENITFNLEAAMTTLGLTPPPGIAGTGSQVYEAEAGYRGSDIATSSGLNVDTGEAEGLLVSPSITATDLFAGKWDFCTITIFEVIWTSLSAGPRIVRYGTLGEVTIDRGFFRAEWRGVMQAYQQNVGRTYSPVCDVVRLGDARCKVNVAPFTFAFTVTSLNSADPLIFYSTDLTQPGPTGGIAIAGISNANPGVITMASAGSFQNGDPVTVSGIPAGGPTLLNISMRIQSLSGAAFSTGIDTHDTAIYPPWTTGGSVVPLGGNAGYFDMGTVTWLIGANTGLTDVVKSYTPGAVVFQLPTAYPMQVGDTGNIVAGCVRSLAACRDKFNNVVNRRAFDYFPGNDVIIQVGRHA